MQLLEFMKVALEQDVGRGDLFERVAPTGEFEAKIISKDSGVLAGVEYATKLQELEDFELSWNKKDGDRVEKQELIATLKGSSSTLLKVERTLLNTLQHASGIATLASSYKELLEDSTITLLDTRKTRPHLRDFEKYASRVGGVVNHRMGLDDSLMLKDTHLKTIDDLSSFMENARANIPWTSKIEIECETFDMAKEAMKVGADIIMCDNMSVDEVRRVLELRDSSFSRVLVEVSGNITKSSIEKYRGLNIDAISSGSMIHQAKWLDFSMKVV
jgi:nicotinate-nucleotide pyrophosphorylase (carboxylating)